MLRRFSIPSPGSVLRELDRARTPESKIRAWSRSLDPIDSIGWLLSITVGHTLPGEGILAFFYRKRPILDEALILK